MPHASRKITLKDHIFLGLAKGSLLYLAVAMVLYGPAIVNNYFGEGYQRIVVVDKPDKSND